ncbi:MAG: twin-arginine translocase TatA/TatE family subunit [Bryobacterales bacterium]
MLSLGLILPTLGVQELLVILLIAVLIFGGRKIPEIGKGLGEGIRQFKDSLRAGKDDDKKDEAKTPTPS